MLINVILETLQGNGILSGTGFCVVPGGGPNHSSIGPTRLNHTYCSYYKNNIVLNKNR